MPGSAPIRSHGGSSPLARGTPVEITQEEHEYGSSPLARGTPHPGVECGLRLRFIPAGAGNTAEAPASVAGVTVHPRWRGEHRQGAACLKAAPGSSPLARGTPASGLCKAFHGRFIPAGAGNTRSAAAPPRGATVHPRWRGEHSATSAKASRPRGSSPLARGTLYEREQKAKAERFIPAGAGNTPR